MKTVHSEALPEAKDRSRTVVVAGATGVVGRHFVAEALRKNWRVRVLSRSGNAVSAGFPDAVEVLRWRPQEASQGHGDAVAVVRSALEGTDVVVNLAGASLAEGRLDNRHKERIRQSRLDATRALVTAWRSSRNRPDVWIQASAVGYYGDTAEAEVTENTPPDAGFFLGNVCMEWEAAVDELARELSPPRIVKLRTGLVFAADAPAWQKLLLPIRLGAGGPLGTGRQWWAWIDADDMARAILFLAERQDAAGAFNIVGPNPARQIDIVRAIASAIRRPAVFPAPAFALRLALGEVADTLLLPSCRAVPRRLREMGFDFEFPDLRVEVDRLLGIQNR